MSIFTLYLLTRFDSLLIMSIFVMICCTVILAISLAVYLSNTDSEYQPEVKVQAATKTILKYNKWPLIISLLFSILIPSKQDTYWIIGGYYVTNSAEIQKLPDNVVGAVNGFLEEYTPKGKKQHPVEDKKEIPHDTGTATGKAT